MPPPTAAASPATIRAWGSTLVQLLLRMKHNGAVEKAAAGLLALSERLLQCTHTALASLPSEWLDDILTWI